jgi:hypothetical protein
MNNAKGDVVSGLSMDALPVHMASGGLQMHDGCRSDQGHVDARA